LKKQIKYRLIGSLQISGDKSISHRSLILSSLAIGKARISNLLESEDTLSTVKILKALSIQIKKDKNEWESLAIYKVSKMNSSVYSKPRIGSDPVNDLVLNNQLIVLKKLLKWCEISLPDGRKGFVKSSDLTKNNNKQKKLNVNHLLKYAKNMMGVPYIWGGNSTKGNDCSGFTQTVFNTQNIQLPRDARQQALLGTEIPLEKSKPGDLFFFGNDNKIKHVGICINGKDFIHQGGKVAINSLDPNSIRFDSHRKETFLFVKRIKS